MSFLERVTAAFAQPARVSSQGQCTLVHKDIPHTLDSFGLQRGIDYCYSEKQECYTARKIRVVDACTGEQRDFNARAPHPTPGQVDLGRLDPREVARHAAAMAELYKSDKSVTIVLALVANAKVMPHSRPVRKNDVNGGVTIDGDLIILWRFDEDFWKVLEHELIHALTGVHDEAVVEAAALRVYSAQRSASENDYRATLAAQLNITSELAQEVSRGGVDAGDTSLAEYTVGAELQMRRLSELRGAHSRESPAPTVDHAYRATAP